MSDNNAAACAAAAAVAVFTFGLRDRAMIACSGEVGEIVGRSEYPEGPAQYLLRYCAADGRAQEAWWPAPALAPAPTLEAVAAVLAEAPQTPPAARATPPRIGETWAEQGGIYAGVVRGDDGDYHLILSPLKPARALSWDEAKTWAEFFATDGHGDFHLPDCRESALLFANLRSEFDEEWHWTSEQLSAGNAWLQSFASGDQLASDKVYKGRARAVRRFLID